MKEKIYTLEEFKEKYNVPKTTKYKDLDKYMVQAMREEGAESCEWITGGDEERGCRVITGMKLIIK